MSQSRSPELSPANQSIMSQAKGTSLSLRPFPISDTKPKSLADFITRINSQPGGFRDVDEDKLRQEQLAQQHALDGEDVDMSDVEEDAEEGDGTGTQDLMQSRMEVLQNIEYVWNMRLEELNPRDQGLTWILRTALLLTPPC